MPSEERTVPREVWVVRNIGQRWDAFGSQTVAEAVATKIGAMTQSDALTVERYVHESCIPVSADTMAALRQSADGHALTREMMIAMEALKDRCVVRTEVLDGK